MGVLLSSGVVHGDLVGYAAHWAWTLSTRRFYVGLYKTRMIKKYKFCVVTTTASHIGSDVTDITAI
jgi:hypothetical protein